MSMGLANSNKKLLLGPKHYLQSLFFFEQTSLQFLGVRSVFFNMHYIFRVCFVMPFWSLAVDS